MDATTGVDDVTEERHPVWLRRFLDQGTMWQKALLSVGAIAGAFVAIGTLAVSINSVVETDDAPVTSTDAADARVGARSFRRPDPVTGETGDANDLVALLADAATKYANDPASPDGRVTLDFFVETEPQDSGRITLNYTCSNEPPCRAALQAWEPTTFDVNHGATRFRGLYIVRIQQGEPDRDVEFGLRKIADLDA